MTVDATMMYLRLLGVVREGSLFSLGVAILHITKLISKWVHQKERSTVCYGRIRLKSGKSPSLFPF